jgi:diguanylate cyclase
VDWARKRARGGDSADPPASYQPFLDALRAEQAASLPDAPLCVVVANIDGLKYIFDWYGIPAGDWAMNALVEVTAAYAPQPTIVGVMPGGQVSVALHNTQAAAAVEVAQRMLDDVRALRAPPKLQPLRGFTASFGVGAFPRPSDSPRPEAWLRATRACDEAKLRGRDRVHLGEWR